MKHPFDLLVLKDRGTALLVSGLVIAFITVLSGLTWHNTTSGLLFVLPIIIAAATLNRWTLLGLAIFCALLSEQLSTAPWAANAASPVATWFLIYCATGLFVSEAVRARRAARQAAQELSEEVERRQSMERQLKSLVEGSPAAILTIDPQGRVLLANEAAHELLKCEPMTLPGTSADDHFPILANFRQANSIRKLARTMLESVCRRRNGETFLAHIWLSSSGAPASTGLSAVVFDASQQLRSQEEGALHTIALSARVVAGSFFHEVRNLTAAMQGLVSRLRELPASRDAEEVEGLSSLVDGLQKLVSAELHPEADEAVDVASLRAVLNHLRIVVEPWFAESGIPIVWREADNLPLVRADQHALLQVFLNLTRNAHRALQDVDGKEFELDATVDKGKVFVRFFNTGPGIQDADNLFKPFQPGAAGSGIGLHVSRAIVRIFGGDLRYEPVRHRTCFVVTLERCLVSDFLEAHHE